MGLGVSIFLIAVGAILRYAVTATVSGISVDAIGLILMVVGVIGLVLSLFLWTALGSWYPGRSGTTVVRRDDCPGGDCIA